RTRRWSRCWKPHRRSWSAEPAIPLAGAAHLYHRLTITPLRLGACVVAITLSAAGGEGLPPQSASQAASQRCARASFRVVVDVGHTVGVPGAMSARGIPEYAFNLQLAHEIKQALVDAGFEQTVLLITATAPRRGLVERAARANSMHANLFIAIHHDSVPDNLNHSWDYGGQKHK